MVLYYELPVTVLQKHYRTLEALALEHEEVEEFLDLTQPDTVRIDKRAGPAIADFVQSAGLNQPATVSKGAKRKVTSKFCGIKIMFDSQADEGSGATNKRPRKDTAPVDVEEIARNGTVSNTLVPACKLSNALLTLQLNKLTILVLKEYLVSQGKKVSGRKQDYIDAVNEHLGL